MSDKEILEKAIRKARDNGWKDNFGLWGSKGLADLILEDHMTSPNPKVTYYEILFNHDFSKALWGEYEHDCDSGYYKKRSLFHNPVTGVNEEIIEDYIKYCLHVDRGWQYHLQQMVIALNPIKYLGEHLND